MHGGLNSAGVLIGWAGERVYILADHGAFGETASGFNRGFKRLPVALPMIGPGGERSVVTRPIEELSYIAYCDPSGGERIREIDFGQPADNSVDDGLNYINQLIADGNFFIVKTCSGVIGEIFDYRRDEKERIVKENDHYIDAMRYGIWSHARTGRPRITFLTG